MFNYETEHIIRKVQDIVLGSKDKVTLRMILSSPIHNAIKVYFRAYVYVHYEEKSPLPSAKSADEIDSLRRELEMLLPTHYSFDKDTFISVLTEAVFFTFNFLCRPRWTMQEFFFQKSESAPARELKQGFIYFSAYEYYPEILFRYMEKHRLSTVTKKQFADLTGKIDRLIFSDAGPDDFIKILQPLSSFVEYGRIDGNGSIPEHALGLFFGDKGFEAIKQYLKRTLSAKSIESISLIDLREILANAPPPLAEYRPDIFPGLETPAASAESPELPGVTEAPVEEEPAEMEEEPSGEVEEKIEEAEETLTEEEIAAIEEEFSGEEIPAAEIEETEEFSTSDITEESPAVDMEIDTDFEPEAEPTEETGEEIEEIGGKPESVEELSENVDEEADTIEEITDLTDEETESIEEQPEVLEEEPETFEAQIDSVENRTEVIEEESEITEELPEVMEEEDETIERQIDSVEDRTEVIEEESEITEEEITEEEGIEEEVSDRYEESGISDEKGPEEEIRQAEEEAGEPGVEEKTSRRFTKPEDYFVPKKTPVTQPQKLEPEPESEPKPEPVPEPDHETESKKPRSKKSERIKPEDIPVPTVPAYTSLELLIDDDERKRFIRKLFNGDAAYYNVIIQTLDKMTSWKEASLYIDEIFLMNGVDPYSSDSVHFTDKVYSRFTNLRSRK
jgi:hypothetical protein